jgi:hypothetical protein
MKNTGKFALDAASRPREPRAGRAAAARRELAARCHDADRHRHAD